MLIDFAITNFRSIKLRQVFSLQSVARISEKPENTFANQNFSLLRSAIIYGRNASGKSNLLHAMDCLFNLTTFENYPLRDAYHPFKILLTNSIAPAEFEISFFAKDARRYNYYVSFTDKKIVEESLFHYPEGKKARLFIRKDQMITTEITQLKEIVKNLYPHHTILSRLNFHKIDELQHPFIFFKKHFVTKSFIGEDRNWEEYPELTIDKWFMPNHIKNLSVLLKAADTGIDSVELKRLKKEDFHFPDGIDERTMNQIIADNSVKVKLKHPVYRGDKLIGTVDFDLEDVSSGTKKLLLFGSFMLDCLSDGDVMIVDELDKGLHPKLMQTIFNIFNNPKTNPNNAQLIVTSHDASLLGANLFRRDQIWISEKDLEGVSTYYTLADLKGVRYEAPFEKYFLKGVFGGNPAINELDFEFNLERTDEVQ
jgi:AAA15 family ATPase/GTPase